jgi:hypothetical protein
VVPPEVEVEELLAEFVEEVEVDGFFEEVEETVSVVVPVTVLVVVLVVVSVEVSTVPSEVASDTLLSVSSETESVFSTEFVSNDPIPDEEIVPEFVLLPVSVEGS